MDFRVSGLFAPPASGGGWVGGAVSWPSVLLRGPP